MSDNNNALATKEDVFGMEHDQDHTSKHYSRCSSAGSTHTPNSSAHNSGGRTLVKIGHADRSRVRGGGS